MYTVKELIEALKQCPEDYTVLMNIRDTYIDCRYDIETVGIDHNEQTVDLFSE